MDGVINALQSGLGVAAHLTCQRTVGSKADDAIFGELTRLAQALDLCLN